MNSCLWRHSLCAALSGLICVRTVNNEHRENGNSTNHHSLLVMTSLMLACVSLAVGVIIVIVIRKHVRRNHGNQQLMSTSTRYIGKISEYTPLNTLLWAMFIHVTKNTILFHYQTVHIPQHYCKWPSKCFPFVISYSCLINTNEWIKLLTAHSFFYSKI